MSLRRASGSEARWASTWPWLVTRLQRGDSFPELCFMVGVTIVASPVSGITCSREIRGPGVYELAQFCRSCRSLECQKLENGDRTVGRLRRGSHRPGHNGRDAHAVR